jgi:hypothetical protein
MAAENKKIFSWGKAGVSYEQYRADVLECGTAGLNTKIDDTAPVAELRKGTRQLEDVDNRMSSQQGDMANNIAERQAIERSIQPGQQVLRIKEIMFETIRQCMIDHQYVRFALTDQQQAEYRKVSGGPANRAKYIHSLASDPAILESQKEAATQ